MYQHPSNAYREFVEILQPRFTVEDHGLVGSKQRHTAVQLRVSVCVEYGDTAYKKSQMTRDFLKNGKSGMTAVIEKRLPAWS